MMKLTTSNLTQKIPYRRVVWVTGFLKTTLSSSLIATGVVLLFNGITNHPLFGASNEISIIVGVLMILLAICIVTLIDMYKDQKKKEELETIGEYIDERAMEIAEDKIRKAMDKLEQ